MGDTPVFGSYVDNKGRGSYLQRRDLLPHRNAILPYHVDTPGVARKTERARRIVRLIYRLRPPLKRLWAQLRYASAS